MKKIILSHRQLSEVIGADFDYLDTTTDNINDFIGDSEIVTNPKVDSDDLSDPMTSDRLGKNIAPRFFYGHRDVRGLMSCGKNNGEKSINESNKDLDNRYYKIPDELYQHLKSTYNSIKNNKNAKGIKRLYNLITDRNLSTGEMYRLKNFFETNTDKENYLNIGGEKLKKWVDNELNNATAISYRSKDTKRKMGETNAFISPHNKEYANNGAHSTESQKINSDIKITYE